MKTRNKGFTLIELLAVIVILAIIALIATPMILGVIETAKKGGAESSAFGYIDAIEKQIALDMLTGDTNIIEGTNDVADINSKVSMKGDKPDGTVDGWVYVEKRQVTDYSFKIGDYFVNYDATNKKASADKNGELRTKPSGGSTQQVSYYAFGDPTTSDTTDYLTLGKNVFVKLEGEQKSVCIVRNGNLSCFKNNNWDEEKNHVQQVFSDISCDVSSSIVGCYASDFGCGVGSYGIVGCGDYGTDEGCSVESDGSVDCGQ